MTPARTICPNCSAQYVADGIAGLCPAYLLKLGEEGIIYRTNSDEGCVATYVPGKKGWF